MTVLRHAYHPTTPTIALPTPSDLSPPTTPPLPPRVIITPSTPSPYTPSRVAPASPSSLPSSATVSSSSSSSTSLRHSRPSPLTRKHSLFDSLEHDPNLLAPPPHSSTGRSAANGATRRRNAVISAAFLLFAVLLVLSSAVCTTTTLDPPRLLSSGFGGRADGPTSWEGMARALKLRLRLALDVRGQQKAGQVGGVIRRFTGRHGHGTRRGEGKSATAGPMSSGAWRAYNAAMKRDNELEHHLGIWDFH